MTGTAGVASSAARFQVAVMAKYPVAGTVKTRLARRLGAEAAADLYRAFILDLDARLRGDGIVTTWAYWPPEAPLQDVLPGARLLAQHGADLGQRMAAVADRLLGASGVPLVLLGADVPHVDLGVVRAAGAALADGDDVVLGPADDGGYYLLGLRRVVPELFRELPWGSDGVCEETRVRCAALGLRLRLVARTFDVDEPADVERLAALVRRGVVVLPHTEAALARMATTGRPS